MHSTRARHTRRLKEEQIQALNWAIQLLPSAASDSTASSPSSSATSEPIAFLFDRGTEGFYFSRAAGRPLESPLTVLIQGVYSRFPDKARQILRNRIWTRTVPNVFERGMIRVAAKRVSVLERSPDEAGTLVSTEKSTLPWHVVELKPFDPAHWRDLGGFEKPLPPRAREVMGSPFTLESAIVFLNDLNSLGPLTPLGHPNPPRLHLLDRPVSALLVDADDRLLSWAVNSNHSNRTQHAELNLIQGYLNKTGSTTLPPGSKLYVSLKPCRMCAGAIWKSAFDPLTIRVTYLENDPGPNAQGTALDEGSPEQILAAHSLRGLP